MISLLFVDDRMDFLTFLKSLAPSLPSEWHFFSCGIGPEAFTFLENNSVDVLIAHKEQWENHNFFLKEVSLRSPCLLRIILRSDASYKEPEEAFGTLIFPIEKQAFQTVFFEKISQFLTLRDWIFAPSGQNELKTLVREVPIPKIYAQALTLGYRLSKSDKKIAELLNKNQKLAQIILQLTNPPFLELSCPVCSIPQMIDLLGVDVVCELILACEILEKMTPQAWTHSVKVGTLTALLTKLESQDEQKMGKSFVAGMLHNFGHLVLKDRMDKDEEILSFSLPSEQAAAALLASWEVSFSIVEAIAYHRTPGACPSSSSFITPLLHAAVALSSAHRIPSLSQEHRLDFDFLLSQGYGPMIPAWTSAVEKRLNDNT